MGNPFINQAFNLRIDDAGRFRLSAPSGEIFENHLLHREKLTLDFEDGHKLICRWQTAEGSPEMLADLARDLLSELAKHPAGAYLSAGLVGKLKAFARRVDRWRGNFDRAERGK